MKAVVRPCLVCSRSSIVASNRVMIRGLSHNADESSSRNTLLNKFHTNKSTNFRFRLVSEIGDMDIPAVTGQPGMQLTGVPRFAYGFINDTAWQESLIKGTRGHACQIVEEQILIHFGFVEYRHIESNGDTFPLNTMISTSEATRNSIDIPKPSQRSIRTKTSPTTDNIEAHLLRPNAF